MRNIVIIVLLAALGLVLSPPRFTVFGQQTTPPAIQANPKDEAAMVLVPAGRFTMGSSAAEIKRLQKGTLDFDAGLLKAESPQHTVFLSAYYIYKYEVTVAQYRQFCHETGHKMPVKAPAWGWKDNHPIVNVSWRDAAAYAKWAGAQLPTEAQWEKAARGTDERTFPWGKAWDPAKCNNSYQHNHDAGQVTTMPVGSYPAGASPYGAMDMAGNAWEWVADWFDAEYYAKSPAKDPTGPVRGSEHVIRGGCYCLGAPATFQAARRFPLCPDTIDKDNRGFRCVVPWVADSDK